MRALVFFSVLLCGALAEAQTFFASAPTDRCSYEARALAPEEPVELLHELPSPGAMAEYPFALVQRAQRIRVVLPDGVLQGSGATVEIETDRVQLRGISHAERVYLYPSRLSFFGQQIAPLAPRRLLVRQASSQAMLVEMESNARMRARTIREWRPCDYAQLQIAPAFSLDEELPAGRARRISPGTRPWLLQVVPQGNEGVGMVPNATDEVWQVGPLLNGWRRVVWITEHQLVRGWSRGPQDSSFALMHPGRGRRAGFGIGWSGPTMTCPRPVRLWADDRGTMREVGVVKIGTPMQRRAPREARTEIVVLDPAIEWAQGVHFFASTAELTGCTLP